MHLGSQLLKKNQTQTKALAFTYPTPLQMLTNKASMKHNQQLHQPQLPLHGGKGISHWANGWKNCTKGGSSTQIWNRTFQHRTGRKRELHATAKI